MKQVSDHTLSRDLYSTEMHITFAMSIDYYHSKTGNRQLTINQKIILN